MKTLVQSMKAKMNSAFPSDMSIAELAFIYVPAVKAQIDDASKKCFASRTDKELIDLSTMYATSVLFAPIQLKRNKPVMSMTTGRYTKFGRRMQVVKLVVATPMFALSLYEIARRKSDDPATQLSREFRSSVSSTRF